MMIMKFGGTSVEDAQAIERVTEIVRSRRKQQPVVVVSALAKVTDKLVMVGHNAAAGDCDSALKSLEELRERHLHIAIEFLGKHSSANVTQQIEQLFTQLADFVRGLVAVRELSPRSTDYLLSFGELLSSQIVAAAFAERGLGAVWVDSRKCVVTDSNHTRALPLMEQTRERSKAAMGKLIEDGIVPVLGGFIAATAEGIPTTLGRGGSDFSAAILGAALGAERIEIWTDVEGMMTTDPRLCPEARTIRRISFNEAAELAYFGAKVLHPATLLPAIQKDIPVYVLNSRNLNSTGTRITAHAPRGRDTFRAITAKSGVSIVNVVASRGVMVHGYLRSVFEALDQHSSSVDIVAISEVSLSFTMETKRLPRALIADLEKIADVTRDDQQAIVCLVGEDIHGKPGIAASVFSTIADAGVNIRMISQGASEINISFVIKEDDVPKAVRHLHSRFFPSHKTSETIRAEDTEGAGSSTAMQVNPNGNGSHSRFDKKLDGRNRRTSSAATASRVESISTSARRGRK
ncbi:MAG: lysine-sensitive aspartokinase 3 [Terriglobales bacterium]